MLITEMHVEFDIALDRISSLDRPDFKPHERDIYLNKAIMLYLKDNYYVDAAAKKGFETNQKVITALGNLHVKSPELQPGIAPVLLSNGRYELKLSSLGNNIGGRYFRYLYATKIVVEIIKDGCSQLCEIRLNQIDDLKLKYTEPSWQWCRVLANFGKSSAYAGTTTISGTTSSYYSETLLNSNLNLNNTLQSLYLDTTNSKGVSQFTISTAYISYIKYPNRVFAGGYNHIDNMSTSSSAQIHCDLDDSVHPKIVEIAANLAKLDIESQLVTKKGTDALSQDN